MSKPDPFHQNVILYPKLQELIFSIIHIKTDEDKWKERIAEVHMAAVTPPKLSDLYPVETLVEEDIPTQVLERMSK